MVTFFMASASGNATMSFTDSFTPSLMRKRLNSWDSLPLLASWMLSGPGLADPGTPE